MERNAGLAKKPLGNSTYSLGRQVEFEVPELRTFVVLQAGQLVTVGGITVYAHTLDITASGALVFIEYCIVDKQPVSHYRRVFNADTWLEVEEQLLRPEKSFH